MKHPVGRNHSKCYPCHFTCSPMSRVLYFRTFPGFSLNTFSNDISVSSTTPVPILRYSTFVIVYYSIYQCCGSGSGSGRIRSFWVTRIRIRILYPQKDPCNLIFLIKYHCLKYSFVQIIFIFDFKCHKMIRFGKKMP